MTARLEFARSVAQAITVVAAVASLGCAIQILRLQRRFFAVQKRMNQALHERLLKLESRP